MILRSYSQPNADNQQFRQALLALITVMQFAEGLSDRQAADAVRGRIDWKYVLGVELTDSGFDCSVLSEFRSRLCEHDLADKLLDLMLVRFQEKNLIKHRGKQPTDSTQVIAAIRQVNRLELVGETLRAALNEISQAVGRFDLRRTRYFGLAKTHLQNVAIACAINLSRFFAWSKHVTKACTRTSSFARLRVQGA